jgi:hypothetical protein
VDFPTPFVLVPSGLPVFECGFITNSGATAIQLNSRKKIDSSNTDEKIYLKISPFDYLIIA